MGRMEAPSRRLESSWTLLKKQKVGLFDVPKKEGDFFELRAQDRFDFETAQVMQSIPTF